MAADNKVEIKVAVDVEGTPKIDQLGKSLNTTAGSANTLGDKSAQSAAGINQANTSAAGYAATSTKLRDGLESVSSQMASARNELLSLVGVGAGAQGLKSIVDLADSYNNLQARIKLVTGEGASFQTAFEGVSAVALRTSSSLESTGNLFAKIAEAGKQMGLGQADALKLTETINQAVQLSGASAQASDAAITQLIQGLQSGVLRGDEFNSIMEQAPRLSKTFADGLGVSTGELRKMAEQGLLTSDTIIKALQGQSDAVAAEFGKLPPTVGRAMTNLTSQFTLYVGEADKAGGYTTKLAGLIDGLASNLSTVATVMIHAGQVMGAMKLLSMAQDWLAVNAATVAHEKALVAATASTVTNTAAKAANTAATLSQAAASTAAAAATSKAAATHDAFGLAIAKQTPALTGNAKALTEMATGLAGTATAA
ncbi:MAG: tape measure protein, partial [Rhodoferax sp.]